jgi:hypothetical protein
MGSRLRICAALAALVASAPAWASWRRAESANFIVYSQSSEQALRNRVALLEDYNAFLRLLTGVNDPPAPNRLPVYVLRNHGALNAVRPMPQGVAGFYAPSSSGIAAFVDDGADGIGEEGNLVLFHEIAHHFMWQYRPTAYPPWYVEGFAEYVSTASFTKSTIEFGQPSRGRAGALTFLNWLPLERVLFSPPPTKADEAALYYAESWLLVHYLLRDEARKAKLITFFNAIRGGEAPPAAFKRIFAVEPRQLQADLVRYGERQLTYSRLKRRFAAETPSMQVTVLPPSADDLMLAAAAMQIGVDDAREAALVAQVRTAAAKYDDDFARRTLAKAEALYGDGAAADRLLDSILTQSPNDAEALYLKGMRLLVAARKQRDKGGPLAKQAQTWFARSHKADDKAFPTLTRYVEASLFNAAPTENIVEVMLLAQQLAPQVVELRMNAASMLLARGHKAEAAILVEPLASDPHNPGLATAAKKMLERARVGAKEGASPASTGE